MSDLRERLIALALEYGRGHYTAKDLEYIARAAARMALEDVLLECSPPAFYDQDDCMTAIRAAAGALK